MNSHLGKTQQNKNQSISNGEAQVKSRRESTLQFIDNLRDWTAIGAVTLNPEKEDVKEVT